MQCVVLSLPFVIYHITSTWSCINLDKPWCRNVRDSVANVIATQMISELSWPPLRYHKNYAQLTLLFKLLHQHLIFQTIIYHPHHHAHRSFSLPIKINIYKYLFFPRAIPKWNNLKVPNLENLILLQFNNILQLQ